MHETRPMIPGTPLVTCVMPTCDRRRFVPHAIDCFLQQDYPHLELLIADDGRDAVADLVPARSSIRYLRMDRSARIGGKRNAVCAEARGDIIVHWDDDDWSAPWRVSYSVRTLLESGADICGLDRVLFYEAGIDRAWEYVYPSGCRPWVHGATLAYRTSFWRAHPFPDIHVGEDTRFVWSDGNPSVRALEHHTFFVGTIHGGNTSPKQTGDHRWRAWPVADARSVIGGGWAAYTRSCNHASSHSQSR
jgi:glycosyltransferase involved in cell wall biosynthesis